MEAGKDAMGQMIYDFYKLGMKTEIHEIVERDDGLIDASIYGPKIYFAELKDWFKGEKNAIKHAKGRVLDIGCGGGRVLKYLDSKGHDTLGIDNSPMAVKACREQGLNAKIVPITKISGKLGQFDTIVMYGNNFGLFGNVKRARWLLKKMYKMTSDDARIIATTVDPYKTKIKYHRDYHERNKKLGRMGGQIKLRIRYHTLIGEWFDYLLVSQKELLWVLDGTGWYLHKTYATNEAIYTMVLKKDS